MPNAAIDSYAQRHQVLGGQLVLTSSAQTREGKSFPVVPIHHPLVSQFTLEGFAVPAVGFIVPGLELIPGGKPDKRMKTQNITKADSVPFGLPVCRSTGNI